MGMDDTTLRNWLSQDRAPLVTAIVQAVRNHVVALNAQGIDFYGYALLPGEPYDIHSLVAVVNCESDIKVGREDDQYLYYRYGVDEWSHWQHDGFDNVNNLLMDANAQFARMQTEDDNRKMDEYESLHSNALLEAVIQGLEVAKDNGVFGTKEPFLVVWISDSGHKIISESVQRLNSQLVAREFMAEFG